MPDYTGYAHDAVVILRAHVCHLPLACLYFGFTDEKPFIVLFSAFAAYRHGRQEFWFGRKYIGLGTFVNGIGVGFIITAFYEPIAAYFGPAEAAGLPVQLLWVALAVPVTALGASLYQTADLGIAPYDYLSLGLRDYTPFPYFGCRVFTDALCALICWLLGGLVGIGTLICAFCLGPFIQFFNGLVSERLLRYKPEKQ